MTTATWSETIALGAVTGMRSMAGPATLAFGYDGMLKRVLAAAAAGEMIADKTSVVGDRTDMLPLAGRAILGAVVGVVIARERGENPMAAGALGAVVSVVAANLAYQVRKRLPLPGALAGVLEDGIVAAVAASYMARRAEPMPVGS